MKTKFIRMLFILSNLLVATLIVLVISLLYTVGFGIDSL
jgi:hypothetical protein